MTATEYVPIPTRLDFDALVPAFARAVNDLDEAATAELDRVGIDPALRELVRLRASQLNGCAYCVDMHARAARRAGVAPQRVDAVAIWSDSNLFTAAERAALHFAEDVTLLARTKVPASTVDAVVAAYGEEGAAALLTLVIAINTWNTIGVTTRCWPTAIRRRD
ncbi:carboxymuconolactone decarboxylase family protein [Micromonospora globbae]|jgi:AhpD family alkylhydroperoxidase|uniref:Carboxymuconolactone decarboxylase family protein n=1 Tax=Micromonospora globbae TaxID=1894969 RepID=A0A420F8S2_9ACTN|nr:carboxymuconolactone decarboxylase family protein [Micromonospora globbae]RKF29305.1 carboxymuconolactone decarboxylase family protein [Micromonospora globbae]